MKGLMLTPYEPSVVDHSPEWGSAELDLEAYLARVGYRGPRANTAEALRALHRAHASAVCFENIDIAIGREVSIGIDALQRKLVGRGRGGYCYETNLLFAAALDRFGFPVTRLLSRIREGARKRRFRSHTSLLVRADDQVWLADPGYGYASLMEPIPLAEGASLTVGGWQWRLRVEEGHWVLEVMRGGGWFDLYAFRQEPQFHVDFQAAHYVSSTRPTSPFVGHLVVQQGQEGARYLLRDRELLTEYPEGRSERVTFAPHAVLRILRETFRLPLTDEEEQRVLRFLETH